MKQYPMKHNKIIILCLAGIGDTLLFIPTLDQITKNYPKSRIDVLVMYKGTKEMLESSYKNINIIWHDFMNKSKFESIKFILSLRRNNYNLCIISYPSNMIEYNLVAFLIGAKQRIAHSYYHGNYFINGSFLLTKLVRQNSKEQGYLHNIEENIKILKALNIKPAKNIELRLEVLDESKRLAKQNLKENKIKEKDLIIGIHAGSGELKNLYLRRWSKEKFSQLINLLIERKKAKVILFGGNNELELKEEIKRLVKNKKNLYLTDNNNMKIDIAMINECDLFITNDSALMHIASALKKPVVAIFGPTNAEWVYPYNTKHITVTKNYPCSPCYFYSRGGLKCNDNNFNCIKKISVEEVFQAVNKLLI